MKLPAYEAPVLKDKEAALELTPSQEVALKAVDFYAEHAQNERPNFGEHARRTADLAYVFAGNDLPSKALDAAYLHDVYDRARGDDDARRQLAAENMSVYFDQPDMTTEERDYVQSLMNDMTTIEDTANWYRETDETYEYDENDPEIWNKTAPPIPLEDMFTLSKSVNIESVLLKSCEMLDNLHNPAETNVAAMQDIHEAESFYAPICEVLGYDGLAMELRSHAKQNRLLNQGEQGQDVVKNVALFCYEMRHLGPQSVLNKFASEDDYEVSTVVNKPRYIEEYSDTSFETVELGEFALAIDERVLTGNWRIKSVGSLAGKLLREDRAPEAPMDVMGMTVISEDTRTLAGDFALMCKRTVEAEGLTPNKAPSKEKAFFVQGDQAFIDTVCEDLRQELGEEFVTQEVQCNKKLEGYQVAKFTCKGDDDMPIEMQFVTKEDRKSGRVGKLAHIFHKQLENGIEYTDEQKTMYALQLEQIYERKRHMIEHGEELTVNPQSLIHSRRAWRGIEHQLARK